MSSNQRLVSKLDEALAIVRKQRRGTCGPALSLGGALRDRFSRGRPFEIRVGAATYTVKPDAVRISKTHIDLGPVALPLFAVTDCPHGEDAEGDPIYGPGLYTESMDVVPLVLA